MKEEKINSYTTITQCILEILSDGKMHTRQEIINKVRGMLSGELNINTFGNRLHNLVKTKVVDSPSRACYILGKPQSNSLAAVSLSILNKAIGDIRKSANSIDVLNYSEKDQRTVIVLKGVLLQLDEMAKQLEDIVDEDTTDN